MSFRLRALALLMLIAVAATAATAWLTLWQVTRQVRESAAAGQQEVARITGELHTYGFTHGTWEGVTATVSRLAKDTGQRIRISTEDDGVLLVDSDVLAGRTPRRVGQGPAVTVDPRPVLRIPTRTMPVTWAKLTVSALQQYRDESRYAACLTRAGVPVAVHTDDWGMPRSSAVAGAGQAAVGCGRPTVPDAAMRADEQAVRKGCVPGGRPLSFACFERIFAQRAGDSAPSRLQVRIGALEESSPTLAAGPTVAVAGGVAAAVIVGALLLSRAVLRPVRALTRASRELGEGDLGRRVPVSGRDEIAALGRAFNRMAGSLQDGEERQRRLMGDIAHELRTPLANLRGYLEALRDGVMDPTPELLDSLHEEALLQQRIVDDLQDLALAEAGALTYHRSEVDLRELLEACRTAHRAQAEGAGVALVAQTPESALVHADPGRLRQAIGNLVGNALRATAPGGTVALVLVRHGELAIVQVQDTGTGIPAEDLPHLFDRFWRGDAARDRATGGSGLGLSIARQIISDHQGTVDVVSTVGVGTTFTIVLTTTAGHTAAGEALVRARPAPGPGPAGRPVPPDTARRTPR